MHPARPRTRIVLVAVVLVATCLLAGCVEMSSEDVPDWVPDFLIPKDAAVETAGPAPTQEVSGGWESGVDPHGRQMPYGSHGHGREVLLLGRSVMNGLFEHWAWDGDNPVIADGYAFYYGEIDSPPAIADSAGAYIENAPAETVVCFKLCFVDFWARSPGDVPGNLQENLGYAQQVADAAQARGVPLLLMTALPDTSANSNAALIDLHSRYNDGVQEIAAAGDDVYVFDIHDVLADQTGALSRGFAASPTDAHLTEVAYLELDEDLLDYLDSVFAP